MSTLKKSGNEKLAAKWVPNKWEYLELTEFAKLYKVKVDPLNSSSNYKCLELEHFEEGTGRINGFTQIRAQKSIKNKFEVGHVLFGKLRPYLRKFWLATFSGVCSSEVWVLTGTQKKCDNAFLFYLVQHSRFIQSANVSTGTKMPRADWDYVSEFPFPLPPLPEQRKIALILSTWDRAIEKTEQLIAKKQQLKTGLMQQLLTGKVRFKEFVKSKKLQKTKLGFIPEEWSEVKLESFVTKVGSGITPDGGESVYKKAGRVFVRSQNVGNGSLLLEDVAFIDESTHQSFPSTEIFANDVLLNITGASIGRCAVADNRAVGGNVNQHVCIIRVNQQVNPHFLKAYLLSELGQNQIDSFQAGGNRQGLNFEQIRSFRIPLPSAREQERISEVIRDLDREIEELTRAQKKREFQKKGLMQQLLAGNVRVKTSRKSE